MFKKKYIYILLAFLIAGFAYSCKDDIDDTEKEATEVPDDSEDPFPVEKAMYGLLVNNLFDIDTLSVPGDTIYSVRYGNQKDALPSVYTNYFDSDTSAYLWFYNTFYVVTSMANDEANSDFAITPKTIDLGEYGSVSYKPSNNGFTLGEVSVNLKDIDVLTKYELLSVNAFQGNYNALCDYGSVYVDSKDNNVVYLCVRTAAQGCDGLLISGYGNGTGHELRHQWRDREKKLSSELDSSFKKFYSGLSSINDYVSFDGCPSYPAWNALAALIDTELNDGQHGLKCFIEFLKYLKKRVPCI